MRARFVVLANGILTTPRLTRIEGARVAEMHAHYIVWFLQTVRARGAATIDVIQEAEEEYAQHCAPVGTVA